MWGQVALGSTAANKAVGNDGIQEVLFKILKDNAIQVLHSICQWIWKTQRWPQDWKRSVFIPILKKDNAKKCSNYHTIALISYDSKDMLKIFQARLQQYVNWELLNVQARFWRGRGIRDQIASIHWIMEKAREFQTNICFIDYTKAFDSILEFCLLRNLYAGQEATVNNWRWNNWLVQNWERSMTRLYIVTLLI